MTSVLAGTPFERHALTYSVRGAQSGTDALGNPTYSITTGTLIAFVTPQKRPHLHRQPGSDPNMTPVKAELVQPLDLPAGVGVGSRLTLTWEGQPATITITAVIPNDLPTVAFGTYMEGELNLG